MPDLERMLNAAREKTAAETAAAELRVSLGRQHAEIVESTSVREGLVRRHAKASGLRGMFRRNSGDAQEIEMEIRRLSAAIEEMESRRVTDQQRFRALEKEAHGAELARAALGAEMRRRTSTLDRGDPARARLAEIDRYREDLVRDRSVAASISALASELLRSVDDAKRADDGSEVFYVELRSASRKWEELTSLLPRTAAGMRTMIKDRLEAFRTLGGAPERFPSLAEIAALAADDNAGDHEVWLHRVRTALNSALESGVHAEKTTREQLVGIDNERLAILNH